MLLENISFPKSFLKTLAKFLAIYQSQSKHSRLVHQKKKKKLKKKDFYMPLFIDEVQLSQGYRATAKIHLFFTIMSPEVPGTHFIDFGRMKGRFKLGATQWF